MAHGSGLPSFDHQCRTNQDVQRDDQEERRGQDDEDLVAERIFETELEAGIVGHRLDEEHGASKEEEPVSLVMRTYEGDGIVVPLVEVGGQLFSFDHDSLVDSRLPRTSPATNGSKY